MSIPSALRRFILLMAWSVVSPPAPVIAQPTAAALSPFAGMPGIVFRRYDISGTTDAQIFASLEAHKLRRPDGRTASGLTKWGLRFDWEGRDGPDCRVRNPRSALDLIVILPRLAGEQALAPAVRARWAAYRDTLERHEAGHARIALAHAGDFARQADGADCADAAAIGRRVVERVAALQDDYDRVTRHGQAQDRVAD